MNPTTYRGYTLEYKDGFYYGAGKKCATIEEAKAYIDSLAGGFDKKFRGKKNIEAAERLAKEAVMEWMKKVFDKSLSLYQAAEKYLDGEVSTESHDRSIAKLAFEAGAAWQKEQDRELVEAMESILRGYESAWRMMGSNINFAERLDVNAARKAIENFNKE